LVLFSIPEEEESTLEFQFSFLSEMRKGSVLSSMRIKMQKSLRINITQLICLL